MGGLALKMSLGDISGRGATHHLKIAARFSTKLAQLFDTISERKFAMGGWLSKRAWIISPEGVQHKI